jgi:hypothetical protein
VYDHSVGGSGTAEVDFRAHYEYDTRNRLESWTPGAGAPRVFGYDSLGNLRFRSTPSGEMQEQHFDHPALGAHVLAAVTPPGQPRSALFNSGRRTVCADSG